MTEHLFTSTSATDLPQREAYQILAATVVPRPIALVSTVSPTGAPNLAPFSFFQIGGSNPPSVVFSPTSGREGAEKDTLANIRGTGEFVINLVTLDIAKQMNETSANLSPGESEWNKTCFSPLDSHLVKPSRVAESPIHFECKLHQIVPHGTGPGSANYVIGEIVMFHIANSLQKDGVLNTENLEIVGRLGGEWYIEISHPQRFTMTRPTAR